VVKWTIGGVAYKGALDLSTAETTKLTCTDLLWEIRDSYDGQPPAKLVLDVHLALNLTNAQGGNFARFVGCISHAGAQTGRVVEFVIHPPSTCSGYDRIRDGCLAFCAGSGIDVKWKVIPPTAPARVTDAPGAPPRPGDDDDDEDASGNVAPARRAIQRGNRTNPLEQAAGYQQVIERVGQKGADLDAEIARRMDGIKRAISEYHPRRFHGDIRSIHPDEFNTLILFDRSFYEHGTFFARQNEILAMLSKNGHWYIDLIAMIAKSTVSLVNNAIGKEEEQRAAISSAESALRLVLRARYLAYVLDNMTEQDAKVWFIVVMRTYSMSWDDSGRRTEYSEYMSKRDEDIFAALGLPWDGDYSDAGAHVGRMGEILGLVDDTIMENIFEWDDGDDVRIRRERTETDNHLKRLETMLWWLFCTHRNADYVDVGGGRAIYEEYVQLGVQRELRRQLRRQQRIIEEQEDARRHELVTRMIAGERAVERERVRVLRVLNGTELRYDLSVEDTTDPDGKDICCVCLDHRRIVTAVPCMHKDFCATCAAFVVQEMRHLDSGLHPCPMCRTPVQYFEISSETNQ
jgi:Zinc finger, C3HC4 type (RING finger)